MRPGGADGDLPDAQLRHRGQRALQHMLEHAPHSGALALWARHRDLDADAAGPADPGDAAGPVFTDGRTLFYRPAFEAVPLPLQAGWVAHQVLHIALRHAQRHEELRARRGDVDLRLWNLCADAIVNSALAHLRWLALPPAALRLEAVLDQVLGERTTAEAALAHWDVERLYLAADDRGRPPERDGRGRDGHDGGASNARADPAGGGLREPRRGTSAPGDPRHDPQHQPTAGAPPRPDGPRAARLRVLGRQQSADLRPRPGDGEAPQDEADAARAWAERLQRAHAGDGEFSLLRTLLADLPRTHTPWEQVLRVRLARALSRQPGPSWSRPFRSWLANRGRTAGGGRLPWEPGRTAARAVPRLAVVLDVSGSIDDALLERFGRELLAVARRLEARLVLVIGDDRVREVRVHEPGRDGFRGLNLGGLALAPVAGGGGTDFAPLLAEAARHDPDLALVLTDLDGPAGPRPPFPVLWAVPPGHAGAAAPFGQVLSLR
ncbi:MAG: DUF2201 family putative metallopeptidase [Pseudomonadota bacterium]